MTDHAIIVYDVSKSFKRYATPVRRLWDLLLPHPAHSTLFHALRNINLEIGTGETWGVMGQNGSGKSTLLQIVAGTLRPTSGSVATHGRIAALLELGSGFNPEFTGRQNVFFNGQILGLTKKEIADKFDEVADFAEIGDFMDQPIKTYSSGMVVRLAFAVLANIEPDILLVDEALSVGDAKFQAKCMKRIRELRRNGVTTFFVSHDISSIQMLCDHSVLLERGEIVTSGKPREVCNRYIEMLSSDGEKSPATEAEDPSEPLCASGKPSLQHGNRKAVIRDVKIENPEGTAVQHVYTGTEFRVRLLIEPRESIEDLVVGISIRNLIGLVIYGTNTALIEETEVQSNVGRRRFEVLFFVPCHLNRGVYTLTAGVHAESGVSYDWMDDVLVFEAVNESLCDGVVDLQAKVEIKES